MATIRDVARKAGVGIGTASRVISGRGPVSKDAAERVNAAVEALDFRPSELARALSTMSAGMIGVYVPDFHGAFFGPFLQTISRELRACHRRMVIASSSGGDDGRTQAIDGIEFLINRECDGIIVFSNLLHDDDLRVLQRRQPRIAVINRVVPGLETCCFSADHHHGGQLAAEALLARGHRRIAVIAGPETALDNVLRLDGFFAALAQAGIDRDQVAIFEGGFEFAGGWKAASELVAQGVDVTALFCANDEMATGAMSYLQAQGVKIPQDISVIGYDNTELAGYTSPRLTSVGIPMREMATGGCRWLLNQCFGNEFSVDRDFAVEVAWRESLTEAR